MENGWFVLNWRRKEDKTPYPSYSQIRSQFDVRLDQFRQHTAETMGTPLVRNLWEVTYVNYVPRGEPWSRPAEWANILPGLLPAPSEDAGQVILATTNTALIDLAPQRGRLRVVPNQESACGQHASGC